MRFDGHRYINCRWCRGSGCIYCEGEADKDYKRAFPEGPKPILTFKDIPEDIAAARSIIGAEALNEIFGPQGGGMQEFIKRIEQLAKDREGQS